MKTPTSQLSSIFGNDREQPVRLIKAAQASKILGGGHTHAANNGANAPHVKPEIRLVRAASDYCDLEVICGCGESTQVRCWNTPAANATTAVAA